MRIFVIYDNSIVPQESIRDVIGEKGFGDVIVKRKKLSVNFKESMIDGTDSMYEWVEISSIYDLEQFMERTSRTVSDEEVKVIHWFSSFVITDKKKAGLAFAKAQFLREGAFFEKGRAAAAVFPNWDDYQKIALSCIEHRSTISVIRDLHYPSIVMDGIEYIGEIFSFIQCITGNFDSRYFNSLKGDKYTLKKSSSNRKKIKAEYTFYHLLPEDMKYWFVAPFDYREDEKKASYRMERLHMTDLAIKWVHGSMDDEEFKELMDKYFYFFSCRHRKNCDVTEYERMAEVLYGEKVRQRIKDLKKQPAFERIERLTRGTTCDIDYLYELYESLKKKVEKKKPIEYFQVIGHGDPCFANALYNKSTQTLKFIDPKGALTKEELWTEPYYDVAKLSHSVCGRYDFFNNALYEIDVDENFELKLKIPFDNRHFVNCFHTKVEEAGFDYLRVRVYEASLFLSMLPLHIDNPYKVLGFMVNARDILQEVQKEV